MNYYCGDEINPFCRDRVMKSYDFEDDERDLWDRAETCVNNTFSTYDKNNVNYYKDENYVLR